MLLQADRIGFCLCLVLVFVLIFSTRFSDVNLDAFYNNHLLPEARDHIIQAVKGKCTRILVVDPDMYIFCHRIRNLGMAAWEK